MRPTLDYIRKKFEYYDRLCFENKLPMPLIKLNMRYGTMGITQYRTVVDNDGKSSNADFSIEISVRMDLPEEEYIDTLVHEMIHYFIAYNNIQDDSPHGSVFQQIMHNITNTYGIRVTIAFDPSDEYLVKSITRIRYVCVADLENGKMGLAVVAKNCLFQLWQQMQNIDGVKRVSWYISNRAIFGKYPVAVSPVLFIENADKIHHYLTGAKELLNDGTTIRIKTGKL